jgi:hypothetical protein
MTYLWSPMQSNLGQPLVERPLPIQDDAFGRPALLCPGCGFHCTHIEEVDVEWRHEDCPVHVDTLSTSDGPTQSEVRDADGGHSTRRHAVVLHLWCEGCWHVHAVAFLQHKGTTYVETVDLGERDTSNGQAERL